MSHLDRYYFASILKLDSPSVCYMFLDSPDVFVCVFVSQGDMEKGLEMKKLVLSGFLASEEIYINQLEALLLVSTTATNFISHTSW